MARSAFRSQSFAGFTGHPAAALAMEKRHPPLHREQWDEKEREMVIHPFQAGLIQTTGLTHPGGFIQRHGLGLNAADEEKHRPFSPSCTI